MIRRYFLGLLQRLADSLLVATIATLVCAAFIVCATLDPLYYLLTGRTLLPDLD